MNDETLEFLASVHSELDKVDEYLKRRRENCLEEIYQIDNHLAVVRDQILKLEDMFELANRKEGA